MSSDLLDELVTEYYDSRPNLEVAHAPLCIFFFACSGAGKSTARKLLVDQLSATYICNDEVRDLLTRHPEATEAGVELKDIASQTVERLFTDSSNKLVIFDNNIIQYFMYEDSYINVAKSHNRPYFVIGLDTPERVLVERIRNRGVNVEQLLAELPEQLRAYRQAAHDIYPDWAIQTAQGTEGLKQLTMFLRAKTQLNLQEERA